LIARKITLPIFTLSELCDSDDCLAKVRNLPESSMTEAIAYTYKPVSSSPSSKAKTAHTYNHMPVILDADAKPWKEANLYILSRLEADSDPSMGTYHGLADDLVSFRRFLDEDKIDFKSFPKRKLQRTTYRYRAHLEYKIQASEIAPTTARRRISSVIGFYKWMETHGFIHPEFPMWAEADKYISINDNKGFRQIKKIKSTDISVKVSKQHADIDESIVDGGKLRPLLPEEQEALIKTLIELGNTEMMLIHFIALFTGARIQTVLTLRVNDVLPEGYPESLSKIPLEVGQGTGIDSKNDKKMILYIPHWLYDKLRVYADSDRAKTRRQKSGNNSRHQYLFLTTRGKPFYQAKADDSIVTRRRIHGQSVREYMRKCIIPVVREKLGNYRWRYQFHDLRATFGMNQTDLQMSLVEKKEINLHQAREFVKKLMGHDSSATTDLYLNYRSKIKMLRTTQAEYEGYLSDLAKKSMDALL
jgi:integrase